MVQVGAWLMHLFMVQVDYRLFGEVIVTSYLYRFGAWFMHLFMVQVDVWYMLAQVVIGCLVQVDWHKFTTVYLTVVPSFYLYAKAVGRSKDRWL